MHDHAPMHQLSIHVSNDNSFARTENDRRKRKNLKPFPIEGTKRAKVSRTANPPNSASSPSTGVAQPNADIPAHTASFRHLFSFANGGGRESEPSRPGEHTPIPNQSFSLLATSSGGDADNLVGTDGGALGVAATVTLNAEQNVSGHQQNYSNTEPVNRRNSTVELQQESSKALSLGTQGQNAILCDELDISPGAVLAMGRNFCREKNIEDLEDEWCKEGGIRDQMRRDFKLKLQNLARDRVY